MWGQSGRFVREGGSKEVPAERVCGPAMASKSPVKPRGGGRPGVATTEMHKQRWNRKNRERIQASARSFRRARGFLGRLSLPTTVSAPSHMEKSMRTRAERVKVAVMGTLMHRSTGCVCIALRRMVDSTLTSSVRNLRWTRFSLARLMIFLIRARCSRCHRVSASCAAAACAGGGKESDLLCSVGGQNKPLSPPVGGWAPSRAGRNSIPQTLHPGE